MTKNRMPCFYDIAAPHAFLGLLILCVLAFSTQANQSTKNLIDTPNNHARKQAKEKWSTALALFEQEHQNQVRDTCILFVGSSTIRMWHTFKNDIGSLSAINRGFGGSTMLDVNILSNELVFRYNPKLVFVYEGDNDLAYGAQLSNFTAPLVKFASEFRQNLPHARLFMLAIKPSPGRFHRWPAYRQANEWMRKQASAHGWNFIDANQGLLNASGRPNPRYYAEDGVHFSPEGYKIWAGNVMTAARRMAPLTTSCHKQ